MLAMTSDFHGVSRNTRDIKESLSQIARAGFSHVHWCHEWTGSYIYSAHEMLQIKEWCGRFGLGVKGVHASAGEKDSDLKDYLSADDYNRLAGVELVKNRVDLAHVLDAEAIVLHLPLPWRLFESNENSRDSFFRRALRSLDELEPYCRTRNIRLCVENESGAPPAHSRYLFDTLFGRYGGDYMGLCFDTGHALMASGKNCLEYVERYNERLFMIHIHDNHGEEDEHLIPFEGGFDWEGFAPVLARSPYKLPVLMEPALRKEDGVREWLEKAFNAGKRFWEMAQSYRPS